ncbi:hypothetical protein RJ639_007332 [Escallonia herrerae]|uniref:Uncharacterized protein n=1 Tax=Escallonia herrerae TaxID=1293975 RepID=A0AA88VX39_9ASTE|nr:hypothetical protein RJ639_007332 [Escallonia herrerae]
MTLMAAPPASDQKNTHHRWTRAMEDSTTHQPSLRTQNHSSPRASRNTSELAEINDDNEDKDDKLVEGDVVWGSNLSIAAALAAAACTSRGETESGRGNDPASSGKLRIAEFPLMLNAATSWARAAISGVGKVPSHMRDFFRGSRISDTHLPHGELECFLVDPGEDGYDEDDVNELELVSEMASRSEKSPQGGFLGVLQKAKGKRKEKQSSVELPPAPKKIRVTPPDRSPIIVERVSIDEDPIFCPRWTLRCTQAGPKCCLALRWREAEEATRHAEELSKQEADYLSRIKTLERRLERVKRKVAEEVKKARDQGIHNFLDGNAGEEWLKKRTDDGLKIYEMGFMKAKEMFVKRFPNITLGDFVMPAVVSPFRETTMPSEVGDAAASHPPGEGLSGDAPEA